MYAAFFGFARRPFSLTPDPEFLFWTDQHRQAFDRVCLSLLRNAPIALVTGEVGAGKTTLIQELMRHISDDFEVALLSNVVGDSGDLLRWILTAFGRSAEPSTPAEAQREVEALLCELWGEGRRSVLIVDEAQNVSDHGIETLRLLTNLDAGKASPLMLVLVGQPQLRDRLRGPRYAAFRQRLGASFHLGPMTLEETEGYVRRRIEIAGGDPGVFDREAIAAVYRRALGVPRLTNLLCDLCLVSAFADGRRRLDGVFVEAALAEGLAEGGLGGLAAEAAVEEGAAAKATAVAAGSPRRRFVRARDASRGAIAGAAARHPVCGRPSLRLVDRQVGQPAVEEAPLQFVAHAEAERPADRAAGHGAAPTALPDAPEPRPRDAWRGAVGSAAGLAVAASLATAALILPATPTDSGQAVTDRADEERLVPAAAAVMATAGTGAAEVPRGTTDATPAPVEAVTAPPDPVAGEALYRRALDDDGLDPAAAALRYARAAARGHRRAAYYLAQLYETGDGVGLAPETARNWYAVAGREVPGAERRLEDLAALRSDGAGHAVPLFSAVDGGVVELVWDGRGSFVVELSAHAAGEPVAYFSTPLTAVRLAVPEGAAWWRVRAVGHPPSAWRPIAPPTAQAILR